MGKENKIVEERKEERENVFGREERPAVVPSEGLCYEWCEGDLEEDRPVGSVEDPIAEAEREAKANGTWQGTRVVTDEEVERNRARMKAEEK